MCGRLPASVRTFLDACLETSTVTRSLSRWQAVLLGIVVLLGGVLGVAGLFAVGSRGWYGRDGFHVRAGFASVRGVEVGTRVRVQGLDAGEVVALAPPEKAGGPVLLRLKLRGEFRPLVRANGVVQIVSEGMIGGKVIEIAPGASGSAGPAEEDALLTTAPAQELTDVLAQVNATLADVRAGEGTVGRLLHDARAYDELLGLLRQGTETLASVQRDADAVKKMPLVGKYVAEDARELLVRPNCERNRRTFAEAELFEPGRAALTAAGRERLDALAPWLEGMKHKNSEVVVAAYADPRAGEPATARLRTQKQSEVVRDYLKNHHAVQKMGWFSTRKVTAIGQGVNAAPEAEAEPGPAARVEVLVFVPQVD
jgi:phospholipid/cholesterol/gamma-HCH transport system substrate-binding protein